MTMLKEGLTFWNPWWVEKNYRMEGIKPRLGIGDVLPLFDRKEVLALTGVRRSGKTSLMHIIIGDLLQKVEPKQIMYVNLEDPTFERATLEEIYRAFEELMLPEDGQYLFLDEIQNKEGWEKWVKKMYDSRKKVKMTVTGSNSSLLKSEFSTYLAGRNLTHEVFPLSFPEHLSFKGVTVKNEAELLSSRSVITHHLESYMKFGGYPEVVLENDEKMKFTLLKEYFSAILSRDILARYDVKERAKLEKLAAFLLTNSSGEISAKSLSKVVDLNIRTVQEYLEHLESVYLFFFVNHFSYSLKAQFTYPRKVYCVDTGMKSAVGFGFSRDDGHLMENLVYLKLRKMGEVYYWKDREADIDFVLKQGKKVTQLIQSCYDTSHEKTDKRETGSLLKGMEQFGLRHGTIITWDREDAKTLDGKTIVYIPLWKWLLADGKSFEESLKDVMSKMEEILPGLPD
jgi:predicted AAA+ superfamily ATPase